MKNIYKYLIIAIIGLANCNKCKDYKLCDYSSKTNEYLNPYKEGNWWIYWNQDNSKKDSLYVTTYNNYSLDQNKDKNFLSKKDCTKYKQTDIKIYTSLMDLDHTIDFSYMTSPNDCNISSVTLFVNSNTYEVSYDNNSGNFNKGTVYTALTLKNNTTYSNVLADNTNTFFFNKDVGLIRYIITPDTFDLQNYYIR